MGACFVPVLVKGCEARAGQQAAVVVMAGLALWVMFAEGQGKTACGRRAVGNGRR